MLMYRMSGKKSLGDFIMLLYVLNPVPTRSSQSHSHFPSFLLLRSFWQCVSRRINSLQYVSLFIHVLSRLKICRLAFCSATRLKLDPFLSLTVFPRPRNSSPSPTRTGSTTMGPSGVTTFWSTSLTANSMTGAPATKSFECRGL
jgi:hypothetical protein